MTAPNPTLEQFLFPQKNEAFIQAILLLADAYQEISDTLVIAPLTGNTQTSSSKNFSGDIQKKMDLVANDILVKHLSSRNLVRRIISEEMEDPQIVGPEQAPSLLLAFDPLDGSSNLEVNGVLATIFGIYQDHADRLPSGRDLLAAGYCLYGPSTILVLSVGGEVHGFTLDPRQGKFVLSHPTLRCPKTGPFICSNVGHFSQWPDNVQAYMDTLLTRTHIEQVQMSLRYSGALATDVHRILLEGGMYVYPPDAQHWTGKIRLLYEAVPMAYLFEKAGGLSSNGYQSLLDVLPATPHQQDHTVLGSRENVLDYVRAIQGAQAKLA